MPQTLIGPWESSFKSQYIANDFPFSEYLQIFSFEAPMPWNRHGVARWFKVDQQPGKLISIEVKNRLWRGTLDLLRWHRASQLHQVSPPTALTPPRSTFKEFSCLFSLWHFPWSSPVQLLQFPLAHLWIARLFNSLRLRWSGLFLIDVIFSYVTSSSSISSSSNSFGTFLNCSACLRASLNIE